MKQRVEFLSLANPLMFSFASFFSLVLCLSLFGATTDGAYTYHYRTRYINNYAGLYGGGVSVSSERKVPCASCYVL
jgi:hypothetical protein